jgi:hypothetical protein
MNGYALDLGQQVNRSKLPTGELGKDHLQIHIQVIAAMREK